MCVWGIHWVASDRGIGRREGVVGVDRGGMYGINKTVDSNKQEKQK